MHPVILSQVAAARIADRQRPERGAIARADRRDHGSPAPRHLHLTALVRRVLALLAVLSRAVRAPVPAAGRLPAVASCTDCT